MTVTAAPSVLSPAALSIQNDITAADQLAIVQALNFSAMHYGECHVSLTCANDDWDDHDAYGPETAPGFGGAVGPMGIAAELAENLEIETDIWIDPDHARGLLELGAECRCAAANTMAIRVRAIGNVGAADVTLTFGNGDNGDELTGSIDLTSVATVGWVTIEVYVEQLTGAAANNELRALRVEELELVTLPEPSDD